VYHIATSVANPLRNDNFVALVSKYFKQEPMLDRNNEPISVKDMIIYNSTRSFMINAWLGYILPLKVDELKATAAGLVPWLGKNGAQKEVRKRALINSKTYEQLTHFSDLYSPYTFYQCRFRASNTEALHRSLSPEDQARFNCDLHSIDWDQYLCNIHIPGLRKFVLKGRGT